MKNLFNIVVAIFAILIVIWSIQNYSGYYFDNYSVKIYTNQPLEIPKQTTPKSILLNTPKDKSFKNFCLKCKKTLNKLSQDDLTQSFLISGACQSCKTPNIPK
jgi:hypothetical protein